MPETLYDDMILRAAAAEGEEFDETAVNDDNTMVRK